MARLASLAVAAFNSPPSTQVMAAAMTTEAGVGTMVAEQVVAVSEEGTVAALPTGTAEVGTPETRANAQLGQNQVGAAGMVTIFVD